jgi:hypothetical protein
MSGRVSDIRTVHSPSSLNTDPTFGLEKAPAGTMLDINATRTITPVFYRIGCNWVMTEEQVADRRTLTSQYRG